MICTWYLVLWATNPIKALFPFVISTMCSQSLRGLG